MGGFRLFSTSENPPGSFFAVLLVCTTCCCCCWLWCWCCCCSCCCFGDVVEDGNGISLPRLQTELGLLNIKRVSHYFFYPHVTCLSPLLDPEYPPCLDKIPSRPCPPLDATLHTKATIFRDHCAFSQRASRTCPSSLRRPSHYHPKGPAPTETASAQKTTQGPAATRKRDTRDGRFRRELPITRARVRTMVTFTVVAVVMGAQTAQTAPERSWAGMWGGCGRRRTGDTCASTSCSRERWRSWGKD